MKIEGLKINILGDSITAGSGASSPDKCFVSVLCSKYGAAARNYGIGGTRISKQRQVSPDPKWDLNFCDRVAAMDDDADLVLIFGGTNDYGHGYAPLGDAESRDPYTFYGALHTLYRSVIEKYPNSRIAVLTPMHRLKENDPGGDRYAYRDHLRGDIAPLKTYVEIIREVAEYYSLPVLDLYKVSGFQPEIPVIRTTYLSDGLHPNDKGHAMLADMVAKFIETL